MPAAPLPQIDYAKPEPRVRRYLRRSVRPVVYLGLALLLYLCAPRLWYLGRVFYAYQQCARHAAAPETLVYSDLPEDMSTLIGSDPAYVQLRHPVRSSVAAYVAAAWPPFYSLISPPGSQPASTVFLGERKTPEGQPMLILVECAWGGFQIRTFTAARPWRVPEQREDRSTLLLDLNWESPGPHRLRIFAGQPDPADPSHLTIAFDNNGDKGVIDGWLRNSGSVDLEIRRPPPTPPPPASASKSP